MYIGTNVLAYEWWLVLNVRNTPAGHLAQRFAFPLTHIAYAVSQK